MKPLVIVGAGGFGREVFDIVDAINRSDPTWELIGFIADQEPDQTLSEPRGARWLGTSQDLVQFCDAYFAAAIGNAEQRRRMSGLAEDAGLSPATLIHPSATFGYGPTPGSGAIVCSHASITTNVRIGQHTHVNLNSTIGHDVVLGDFVTLNPGANVSGNVSVGHGAMIGTNAAVIQGVRVGSGAQVGAGAVVARDVPAGTTVVGVPARPLHTASQGD